MSAPSYERETARILVRATPVFLLDESQPEESRFFWAYTIAIENRSDDVVQLRARHWRITDATGHVQEVRGPGVVGEEPVLAPGEAFSYTSGCPLSTPSGMMEGAYHMVRTRTGEAFNIAIPAFALVSPFEVGRAN